MKSINLYFIKSQNNVIGKENEFLYYLQREQTEIRSKTENQIILFGKRTWETIPTNSKPLQNRLNVIATRDKTFTCFNEFTHVIYDLDWYIDSYISDRDENRQLWILGGYDIYNQTINKADRIEVVEIMQDFQGEIKAPKIDKRKFKLSISTESYRDQFYDLEYFKSIYTRK
jgi:dihydrofolate reductase